MVPIFDTSHIINAYRYIGIFIIVFLESGIFFALPADSLLFSMGLLASTTLGWNIYLLILVIFIASWTGGMAGYWIGSRLEKFRNMIVFRTILKKKYIDEAHAFFNKHGTSTIIFSRFVPIVRTFTPIVAGIVRVPHKFFMKNNFIGALLWSISITSLGYFLGRSYPQIKDYLSEIIILIVVVSILPGAVKIIKDRYKS